MIMECTDCEHCISYGDGFRIACGHSDLPDDYVYRYYPVGKGDASRCSGFEEGDPKIEMSMDDIDKAVELFGDDISSLRKYAIQKSKGETL
jgi:hypothetical protein